MYMLCLFKRDFKFLKQLFETVVVCTCAVKCNNILNTVCVQKKALHARCLHLTYSLHVFKLLESQIGLDLSSSQ